MNNLTKFWICIIIMVLDGIFYFYSKRKDKQNKNNKLSNICFALNILLIIGIIIL